MDIQFSENQIEELRRLGIITIYIFGSHAEGTADKNSDLDIAVLLKDTQALRSSASLMDLYQKLYSLFSDILPGDTDTIIDIVFLQAGVSLELQGHVVKHGRIIFDDDPLKRGSYEEQVMIRAADFAPILEIMDKAILERI